MQRKGASHPVFAWPDGSRRSAHWTVQFRATLQHRLRFPPEQFCECIIGESEDYGRSVTFQRLNQTSGCAFFAVAPTSTFISLIVSDNPEE
jgi:hypothetical protein